MPAIYRDFDQAGLDAAYNNRAVVPDHGRFLERWQQASEAARRHPGARIGIPYGPSDRQRLDVFPAGRGPAPCVLFLHGGYWQSLDRTSFAWLGPPLSGRGIAFVSTGYDLCPEVELGEIVRQARRAYGWLQANAAEHGIDRARIVIAGHSAGGHLAALLVHTDWAAESLSSPAGGLALSGLYDLEPIRLSYLNAALRLSAAQARALSPIHAIREAAAPLALVVGAAETAEFRRQQRDYASALTAAGAPLVATAETTGDHHFSILDQLALPVGPVHDALARLTGA
jgi:arylformamidase